MLVMLQIHNRIQHSFNFCKLLNNCFASLTAQAVLHGVVAFRYRGGVDNEMPQLHTALSEPLDYCFAISALKLESASQLLNKSSTLF